MTFFKNKNQEKAFTLLEIMLVITLLMIVLGFGTLFSQTSQVRADVNAQASVLVSYLRLAQSDAMAGQDNQGHGVHLETNAYTIFKGNTYNVSDSSNFVITFPSSVTIQNIALNGGGSDVIFTTPQGETSTYGTFDLYSSQIQKTVTLTISQLGTVSY